MHTNNKGHMTKMAAMPIYMYGKNPSKIFFSETNRLDVKHRWLKYSNVYVNHDPVMTLTKFMARTTWVAKSQVSVYRTIGPLVISVFVIAETFLKGGFDTILFL